MALQIRARTTSRTASGRERAKLPLQSLAKVWEERRASREHDVGEERLAQVGQAGTDRLGHALSRAGLLDEIIERAARTFANFAHVTNLWNLGASLTTAFLSFLKISIVYRSAWFSDF